MDTVQSESTMDLGIIEVKRYYEGIKVLERWYKSSLSISIILNLRSHSRSRLFAMFQWEVQLSWARFFACYVGLLEVISE